MEKEQIRFYLKDADFLDPLSAFEIAIDGITFKTPEHAYHWHKFSDLKIRKQILDARSPIEAKNIAGKYDLKKRPDWNQKTKLKAMEKIFRTVLDQHPYVRAILSGTGNKELICNSPFDSFWGRGPNDKGQNYIGRIWMKLRGEISSEVYVPVKSFSEVNFDDEDFFDGLTLHRP
jgi:N-glycosidase YbiA